MLLINSVKVLQVQLNQLQQYSHILRLNKLEPGSLSSPEKLNQQHRFLFAWNILTYSRPAKVISAPLRTALVFPG